MTTAERNAAAALADWLARSGPRSRDLRDAFGNDPGGVAARRSIRRLRDRGELKRFGVAMYGGYVWLTRPDSVDAEQAAEFEGSKRAGKMTEAFLRETAAAYGLEVLKRVTTGTERAGFATFELSGPADRVRDAWEVLKPHGRGRDFDALTAVDNPSHPDNGKPFIRCGSVYFDQGNP